MYHFLEIIDIFHLMPMDTNNTQARHNEYLLSQYQKAVGCKPQEHDKDE